MLHTWGNGVPIWSQWVTFILGAVVALATLGGLLWAWQRRCAPLRLGLSVQPYAAGGIAPGNGDYVCPWECLQLDIRNASEQTVTLRAVRMRDAAGREQPLFADDLGERWALEAALPPGQSARVVCGGSQEHTLSAIDSIVVRADGGMLATLPGRAVRKAVRELAAVRASGRYRRD